MFKASIKVLTLIIDVYCLFVSKCIECSDAKVFLPFSTSFHLKANKILVCIDAKNLVWEGSLNKSRNFMRVAAMPRPKIKVML